MVIGTHPFRKFILWNSHSPLRGGDGRPPKIAEEKGQRGHRLLFNRIHCTKIPWHKQKPGADGSGTRKDVWAK